MDDIKNWLKIDTFNSIRVEKYNDKYSVQLGSRGNNDTYVKYCTPQKWSNGEKQPLQKNGNYVYTPWSIPLGTDKEKAAKTLEALAYAVRAL